MNGGTPAELRLGDNIAMGSNTRTDVGVIIRSSFEPANDNLLFETTLEMTSADPDKSIRKISVHGESLLVPGKDAVVASLEDPVSHEKYLLSATAVKLD